MVQRFGARKNQEGFGAHRPGAGRGGGVKKERTCNWTEDWDGNWETSCSQTFVTIAGTPIENEMAYCCYCGAVLEQKEFRDETEPSTEGP